MKVMSERKNLKELSWDVNEQEYREDKALSYSTLSRFNKEGFNGLDKIFDKIDSPSLIFGSMVDVLITGGQEEFDEKFIVAEFPPLPDSQIGVVKYLFNNCSENYNTLNKIPDDLIITATEVLEFQKNWKPETRAKVIKENGGEYYNLLHLSIGKTLVGIKEYQDAQQCVEVLLNSDTTSQLFSKVNPFDDDTEKHYQLKFKGTYNGISLRCMSDLIIVDHQHKIVYPFDLKTSFKKEWDFPLSFIQWGYWIQAQFYWYIIRQNMDNDPIYKEYKLADYQFIIISNGTKIPLIWEYPDTTLETTVYYGRNNTIKCRNWRELVIELNYYLTEKPTMPIGIEKVNNILQWLNYE